MLFATHYHELAKLERLYPQLKNIHLETVEHKGQLKFLYRILQGAAFKSYGVKVAELAGLPRSITQRAQHLLKGLESSSPGNSQMSLLSFDSNAKDDANQDVEAFEFEQAQAQQLSELKEKLQKIDLNATTPLQALNLLSELKQSV